MLICTLTIQTYSLKQLSVKVRLLEFITTFQLEPWYTLRLVLPFVFLKTQTSLVSRIAFKTFPSRYMGGKPPVSSFIFRDKDTTILFTTPNPAPAATLTLFSQV